MNVEEEFVLDSISGRHHATRRGGLLAIAALLVAAWLSACGSSSTGSPAAASAPPTQTAASKVPAPPVSALAGVPSSCASGASDAAVSTAAGKTVKLASEQPVTDTLTCWYTVEGQAFPGGLGPISLIYYTMASVPTRADFDHLVSSFRAGHSGSAAPTLEEIPGVGDFAVWVVETIPGYGTVWQVAASKGKLLVAFGVASMAVQGDRSRMTALVRALLG